MSAASVFLIIIGVGAVITAILWIWLAYIFYKEVIQKGIDRE